MTAAAGQVPATWVELAKMLTAFLPGLAPEAAAEVVATMTPAARGRIRAHLGEHPDALVSGASLAPPAVQRLITDLREQGIEATAPACVRCGRVRRLRRLVPGGRVCLGCEGILAAHANVGTCTSCTRIRPRPVGDTCTPCRQRAQASTRSCTGCGRLSHMDPCTTCRPRPPAPCALCSASSPVCARWPLGPVCKPCYALARREPGPCPGCSAVKVLIARIGGQRTCGPCGGHPDPYACPRCGAASSPITGDLCDCCAIDHHLNTLLHDLPPEPTAQLAPLREAFMAAEHPRTVLTWLRTSASARLLHEATACGRLLTHADLDIVAGSGRGAAQSTDYLRGLLVAFGVLPPRDEHLAAIERHLARTLTRHPKYAMLLGPYVRWSVMPRARRRATRSASTRGRARWAYTRINTAVALLEYLASLDLTLPEATQLEIDRWLAAGPSTRYEVRDFLVWTARRGHSDDLLVPHRGKAEPEGIDEDTHWDLLQQCLHDEDLPLDVRAAGSLLLLFGQHLTHIITLTTGHLDHQDSHQTIRLDSTPIRLPHPLATLLTRLIDQQPRQGWSGNTPGTWLFPGSRPGTHRSASSLARALTGHGIPIRSSRATALIQLAEEMPPAVLAPLLGLHVITALQWRRRAATDWTAYLQARQRALADRRPPSGP
ncbi:hypothetical protein ACH4EC_11400 [Streptomyces anulatus]